MKHTNWRSAIEDHYRRAWGGFAPCLFGEGPISELPGDFGVICFPPRPTRDAWTYATCGMAQPGDSHPLELHLFSSEQDGGIVGLLYAVAHYHRTGAQLGLGHSVNFGRSWLPYSKCTRGLISLPYLDGPALEECHALGNEVRCLWLIPVTPAEVEYKHQFGLEALEERFERSGFDYLDPERSSVA